jgi:hypothetical protein
MNEPFQGLPERGDSRFTSPAEELAYLREQIAYKEQQLEKQGHRLEKEALTHEVVTQYKEQPTHEVLHDTHALSGSEVELILKSLNLAPDQDDTVIEELLGVLEEKGLKNALTVAGQLNNPHIEDDFHRVLIQYVAQGHTINDVREYSPTWNVLHMTLFEVTLPDGQTGAQEKPLSELISVMEQFYYGLLSIGQEQKGKRYFTFEVAVSGEREDIAFYMAVPSDKEHLFEKQLLSMFPKARVHHVPDDYNIFIHGNVTALATLTLKKPALYPLKDYREFDHDPLSVLINTLTKIETVGEGAAIQYVVHPQESTHAHRYKRILEKLEKGMSVKQALNDTPEHLGGEFVKTFKELIRNEKKITTEPEEKTRDDDAIEQVRKKLETPIVNVTVRLVASAKTETRAHAILSDIQSSFNQFATTNGNSVIFTEAKGKMSPLLVKQFTFREFNAKQAVPLSVRELATLAHLPTFSVSTTPQLKRVRAADAPAPVGLPSSGTLLGVNRFRGAKTNIYLTTEDRLRHLYVIGQTGTGKTAFMKNLIQQDIENGDGVCFIDPHGSDVEDILANIPEHRIDDVIYFDPANTKQVMGLNMLEYDSRFPEQKTFVINELFSMFKKLYAGTPESMGPAFEQYFRNATALVLEDPKTGSTMLDISRVLADPTYREVKLSRSNNPVINQFWKEIATKAQGEASLQNIVPYITNKFDIFTANDIMRPIIAQQESSFRMREVMDTRKILLVNLSKGRLGNINANLLGMVLVGKMLMAALSRVDALASDLPPFYLYIDEFQNITTDSISAILSEARKYKLSLTIAHQFIAQLDKDIRDAVFGNVGSMTIFRVGSDDASVLESQLAPTFEAQDIMNIQNYHAYVRILANGTPQKPFSVQTLPPKKGNAERANHIREVSLMRYARPRETVEQDINMRYGISSS